MAELDMSKKSRPGASLVVNLPLIVQIGNGTFKKQTLKIGDSRIVLLQFHAYQKNWAICEADTSIPFWRNVRISLLIIGQNCCFCSFFKATFPQHPHIYKWKMGELNKW